MLLLFCNIGWMSHYQGENVAGDKIIGGGPDDQEKIEVCNFLQCTDGNVYGHVETSKKGNEQQIHIERLWGTQQNDHSKDEYADGATVVWTAPHPTEGGRRVIGWYKNARVWRYRQSFETFPSEQHRVDKINNYRISTSGDNVTLLPGDARDLRLNRGSGWLGQNACWYPDPTKPDIAAFLNHVKALINNYSDLESDLAEVRSDESLTETEKERLTQARIGQGPFRKSLVERWGSCAVTGCPEQKLLRASHIKPWSKSDNVERLDPDNGLLLIANLDAAFDKGLISFTDDGHVLISDELSEETRGMIGITSKTTLRRRPTRKQQEYLEWHRKGCFHNKQ